MFSFGVFARDEGISDFSIGCVLIPHAYQKLFFLFLNQNILLVLKRTVSTQRVCSFEHPKHVKTDRKETIFKFRGKKFV